MRPKTVPDRVITDIEVVSNGCWLWKLATNPKGYGILNNRRSRNSLAHREFYEHFVGEIPEGLQLDHLCRVRRCVNPGHLEPVTHEENQRRGVGPWGSITITHCPRGHEYTPENTLPTRNSRRCLTCTRLQDKLRKREIYRKRKMKDYFEAITA
jgi:hypothetical protein